METLAKFRKVVESRHEFAAEWKRKSGRKVVGMMCKYLPEEMIHAAGALPVFITGTMGELDRVNEFLQENTCPYMRSCLEVGLGGDYDYLDGLVVTHSCDVMSKMHDFWKNRTVVPSVFLLDFPHKVNENALVFFRRIMDEFKTYLEEKVGPKITDEALRASIRVYNEYRDLLRQLYRLRVKSPAPITGLETFTVVLSTLMMRKEEAIGMLKQLLREIAQRRDVPPEGVRVMVTGTDVDNLDFFDLLEDCGATIVADDLCTGSRYFWKSVDETGQPLDALASRYLQNIPCSRTGPSEDRYEHISKLAKEYRVQGIIMPILNFCDAHSFDAPYVMDLIKEDGIPVRKVEIDHTKGGMEQIRPIVEAFVEIIKEGGRA
jgi:benzoyl-CoA reductase subunit C